MELLVALVLIVTAGSAQKLYPQYRYNRNFYSPKLFVGYNQDGNKIFVQNGVKTIVPAQGQLSNTNNFNSIQPLPTYRPLTPWNPRASNNNFQSNSGKLTYTQLNSNLAQINNAKQSGNSRITIINGRKTTNVVTVPPTSSASSPVTCDYQPNFIYNKINPANRRSDDVLVISANTASQPNTIYDILSNVDSLTSLSKTTNVFIATIPMKNNQPVLNANARVANQKIRDFVGQIPTLKLLDAEAMDTNLRKYGITWGITELCKWVRDETARQISGGGVNTTTSGSGVVTNPLLTTTTTKATVTTTTKSTVTTTKTGVSATTEAAETTVGDTTDDTTIEESVETTTAGADY